MTTHPATPDQSNPVGKTPEMVEALRCPSCRNGDLYACTCPFPTTRNMDSTAGVPADKQRVDGFVDFMLTNCTNPELHAHEEQAIRDMVRNLQEWRNGKHDDYVRGLGGEKPGSPALAGGYHRVGTGVGSVATGGAVATQAGAESYPPLPNPRAWVMEWSNHSPSFTDDKSDHVSWFAGRASYPEELKDLYTTEQMRAYADATAALRARGAVPSGWKLVPVERNYEQRAKALIAFNTTEAKKGCDRDDALQAAWEATLEAAPAAPGSGVEQDAAHDDLMHCYWIMMRECESKADNEKDATLRVQVEGFYRLWNRVNGSNLKPRWMERSEAAKGQEGGA